MGILSDLFKSKTNWTMVELHCIMHLMTAMGGADGDFDEDEKLAAIKLINALPGVEVRDWHQFFSSYGNATSDVF